MQYRIFGRHTGLRVSELARATNALIPILGSRTPEQFDATLGALEVKLSLGQLARLDTASAIPLGVPHDQINSSVSRVTGAKPELLAPPLVPVA